MTVKKLDENSKTEFDEFVANHPFGTFLQSWGWGEWQISQHKKVERYFFMSEDRIAGAAQLILNTSPLGQYWYCPYGPLWDRSTEDKTVTELLQSLKAEVTAKKNVLFLRIEPTQQFVVKELQARKSAAVHPPQTLITNIEPAGEELLKSFHHKTRYNIKVAQKQGVSITSHKEVKSEVIDLIMMTSERQNYRNHSAEYIKKLWEFFAENSTNITITGYLASQNSQPLAAGLMVDFGKTRMYLFGGSNYEYRNLMAPYLLHWQAILDAKELGFTRYDFGATENASGHTGGYLRFKLGFNPQTINFAGTYDLVAKNYHYYLFSILRKLNRLRLHV